METGKNSEEISVSIICNTFQHEKYIAEALDSFLKQKTNFNFEILVHDDASTDRTADIIRQYAERYPDKIFPVIQAENQYSKGILISKEFQYPRARGKYFALCEGDDFWIDENKLQRQFDYMQTHPECTLCISNAQVRSPEGKIIGELSLTKVDRIIPPEEVMLGGGFCATNSIFSYSELMRNQPDYFNILSIDLVIQMYLASCGTTFCFADQMVVYRKGVEGSWCTRMRNSTEKRIQHWEKCIAVRRAFDEATGGKYHTTVEEICNNLQFRIKWMQGDFAGLCASEFQHPYQKLSKKEKIRFQMEKHCQKIYRIANRSWLRVREYIKK